MLFATTPMTGALEDVVGAVQAVLRPRTLIGATAVSLLARGQEVEDTTAALALGRDDRTRARRCASRRSTGPEGPVLGGLPEDTTPGSHPPAPGRPVLVPGRDRAGASSPAPDVTAIGGLASAARGPGGNRLVLDGRLYDDGAVGVLVPPGHIVEPLVSQGCRPLGEPMIVTRAERNIVYELAGKPALERVVDLAAAASPEDRALLAGGTPRRRGGRRGEGQLRARRLPRPGGAGRRPVERRDGDRSGRRGRHDHPVPRARRGLGRRGPAGHARRGRRGRRPASCSRAPAAARTCSAGRTTTPSWSRRSPRGRCAGMFCAGEIGPIGRRSFLHSFTASVALFR